MIAGVDEVGRGCLAGPVCACAVVIRERIPLLQDSKKLSPKKRLELSRQILNSAWVGYGEVDAQTIDQINIHQASLLACLLYTSPSPRDRQKSRMPSSA